MKRKRLLTAAAGTLIAAAIAGVAWASIPGPGSVYTACMLKGLGTIRLIDKSLPPTNVMSHCTNKETEISWNQAGQPGPLGPKGDQGSPGAAGPAGLAGPAGAVGPAGREGPNGADGATGPAGPVGATGPQGPTGDKGDPGDLALAGRSCPSGSFLTGFDSSGDLVCAAPGDDDGGGGGGSPGELLITPLALAFAETQVGELSGPLIVTFTNTGTADVLVPIALAGAHAADFLLGGSCTVPAQGTCALSVYFAPTVPGSRSAAILVQRPSGDTVSIVLAGTGG